VPLVDSNLSWSGLQQEASNLGSGSGDLNWLVPAAESTRLSTRNVQPEV